MLARVLDNDGAIGPERLALVLIDDQDKLVLIAEFDPDALDAAMTELHRGWWATLSDDERATVRVAGDFGRAFREQDPETLELVLAPEFVAIGHGDLGLPEMDRAQYLTSHDGRNDLFAPTRQFYDVAALPSPDVMVIRSAVITSPGDIGWEDVAWNVLQVRDGRLVRLEVYAETDPDDAAPLEWAHRRAREIIDQVAG